METRLNFENEKKGILKKLSMTTGIPIGILALAWTVYNSLQSDIKSSIEKINKNEIVIEKTSENLKMLNEVFIRDISNINQKIDKIYNHLIRRNR